MRKRTGAHGRAWERLDVETPCQRKRGGRALTRDVMSRGRERARAGHGGAWRGTSRGWRRRCCSQTGRVSASVDDAGDSVLARDLTPQQLRN